MPSQHCKYRRGFQKGRNNNGIAEAYKLYGRIYRYQKNWDAAIEAFTQSVHLYQTCQNPQGEAEGCYEFGLMYKNCQNPAQARHFLQSAHHLYEQLGATDAIKRVDAALATLDV
ncbi:tetratricopeptide repeat protein [Candidatus Poribacteria bacterium]|nr:tetratricopeptide repeat protein [Candidatus Poribacteria bacterium]